MRELPDLVDDGLITPTVGDWAEDKYRLFGCYADLFSTSMKSKWAHRVYVDLYAGPGRARIRKTRRIIPAPPLLALDLRFPFTRYIFSEFSEEKLAALKKRVSAIAPTADAHYVVGDSNENVGRIVDLIPAATRGEKVLTFCFADPYRLADLQFSTIEQLAKRFIDFLFLIPSGMDASRNRRTYLRSENNALDAFLGDPTWRSRWNEALRKGQRFVEFVVDEFGRSMAKLDYRYSGLTDAHLMSSTTRRLPIYHLLMLSRHPLGGDFWEKCRKSETRQKKLF